MKYIAAVLVAFGLIAAVAYAYPRQPNMHRHQPNMHKHHRNHQPELNRHHQPERHNHCPRCHPCGRRFAHGYYYPRSACHWSFRIYHSHYRTTVYFCSYTRCFYYWCKPDCRFYPIHHCPYGRYCW